MKNSLIYEEFILYFGVVIEKIYNRKRKRQ